VQNGNVGGAFQVHVLVQARDHVRQFCQAAFQGKEKGEEKEKKRKKKKRKEQEKEKEDVPPHLRAQHRAKWECGRSVPSTCPGASA
jgi:hypothetical protein